MIKKDILLVLLIFILTTISIFGQQKLICGYIDNQTKGERFECYGIIIYDSLYLVTNENKMPFVYYNLDNQLIDSFKIRCSYMHHPVIFVNIPEKDSIDLGNVPMFASTCFYHFIDDRNNIFSKISSLKLDWKTERFYKKKDSKIEKYRYFYNNHEYNIMRSEDDLIIDLKNYIE